MPAGRDATPSPFDENDNFCSILFFRNKTWNYNEMRFILDDHFYICGFVMRV